MGKMVSVSVENPPRWNCHYHYTPRWPSARLAPLRHHTNTSAGTRVIARGELSPTAAATLHRRHRGDIREALRELYDRHAENDIDALPLTTFRD